MAAVNFSRVSYAVVLIACATSLAACGSDAGTSTSTTSSSTALADVYAPPISQPPAEPSPCPSAPAAAGKPDWTLTGATGSVAVTAATDAAGPGVKVEAPFSVAQTQVHTLKAGDGPVVAPTATVLVCYMGVNGRDGSVFDSTYQRGAPTDFPLDGVVPGFQKAIAGQKVGSSVAVAMVPADGYPEGQPAAGIQPGDTLVFAIKILDAKQG